jgi:cytochrome c-type biogenesis protein CcmH
MSIVFFILLLLSIIVISYVTWRVVGDALLLLARQAGERRMRWTMALLAALLIAAAAGATWLFARQAKQAAVLSADSLVAMPASASVNGEDELRRLLDRLDQHLKREPDDAQGWALFARTQLQLQRYPDAARTYAKAVIMLPKDADLQVEFANAELMANGRQWTQAAIDATDAALALSPEHLEALWLAGTYRFERKDYAATVRYWEKLLRLAPADSDYALDLVGKMAEARALRDGQDPAATVIPGIGGRRLPEVAPNRSASPPGGVSGEKENGAGKLHGMPRETRATSPVAVVAARGNRAWGEATLQPAPPGRIAPGDMVFLVIPADGTQNTSISAADGRWRIADLPGRFDLSDNAAMPPEFKPSSASRIVSVVRDSGSGAAPVRARAAAGASRAVTVDDSGISVAIDKPI